MAYAYRHVRVVKNVKMTGYIRTQTWKKWTSIFKHPRRAQAEDIVGRQMEEIEALSATEVPPRCLCPKRCNFIDIERLEDGRMSGLD